MTLPFGPLLKQLRKQAGMTQRDLAAALGYSESLICNLEKAQRQPDLHAVTERFVAALGLQDDPQTAAALIEQAALVRGERPPASVTFQRTIQTLVQAELRQAQLPNSVKALVAEPVKALVAEPVEALVAEPVEALPSPPTELIGRAAEINQLCNRLLGHNGRLLTLIGPPGIGKTTLALAVAARLQLHYPNGAVFVALAAVSDPVLMASTILAAVGSTDLSSPRSKLIAFLRRKIILLVLDNLEQMSDAAPLIAELVAECPGLCILATSRERLHLRAEQRYKVPPLELAPAVELFTQRAQAIEGSFRCTPHNQPILEAICQRLDCLPLALELCAAQIELFSPTQLLTQLQDRRLDLLIDGAHDLSPHHRTLRAAIGRSYALLTDEERSLFRSLAVFAGGFDLSALEVVGDSRLEPRDQALNDGPSPYSLVSGLRSLIGKSLVRAETTLAGEQRFLLLETIREFALEQVRTHGEETLLRQRHYSAYLHLFRTADSHLRGPDAATWFMRLDPDQDNLRAALQWALETARYEDMAWLIVAANWFWNHRGQWYEAARWLAQLLPYRRMLEDDLRLAILIIFHANALAMEDSHPVERYRAEMLRLLQTSPHQLLQVAAWVWLALYSTDFSQLTSAYERAIALARAASESPELGTEFGLLADRDFLLGVALAGYADNLCIRGDLVRAALLATESFQFLQARGNRYERADGLGVLGRLALLRGDLAQARTLFQEAVAISIAAKSDEMQGNWQSLLGLVTLYSGNVAEAQQLLHEGLRLCLEMKNKFLLALVCTYLAETALWEGKLDEAEQWLRQSLGYHANPHQITTTELQQLFVAARLGTAQQQYPRAATLFGLAEQMHSQIHHAIAGPMRTLADAALATVRAALDPAVFAEAFTAGQQMSLAEAFATLLAPGHGLPQRLEAA